MRAQIFHLLENGNVKGHLNSFSSGIDNDIIVRQGVVTFNSVEELYEQYMKSLADIRETDRFINELEEEHTKELNEITQRECVLKENLEQLRIKLEQTRTDLNIQTLAKQVLDREQSLNPSKASTNANHIQTDMNVNDIKYMENNIKHLQRMVENKDLELNRIYDQNK